MISKALFLALATSWISFGALVQVSSPGALAPNSVLSWDSVGVAGTNFSGSVSASTGGVTVTAASTQLQRVDESFLWTGSFMLNDFLLWNGDTGDSMTFTFSHPIKGVGAFVQGDTFGPFTVTLTAFNGAGTALGSVTVGGSNSGAEDGSAPFLGVLSSGVDISKIVFTESDPTGSNELAIDSLQMVTGVPEPGTVGLVGLIVVGCFVFRVRNAG